MQSLGSRHDDVTRDPSDAVLALLSDQALADWYQRTMLAAAMSPRFTLRRVRWRRAYRSAGRAFSERVLRDAGLTCDLCGEKRPTSHGAIGKGEALRFTHYCRECAVGASNGWFVIALSIASASARQ
jgi:hypothetical protein